MPGIPRSRGCSNCKLRRVKCDETWPSCERCKRHGIVCTGPTELIKFVHRGRHPNHRLPVQPSAGGSGDPSQSPFQLQCVSQSSIPGTVRQAHSGYMMSFRLAQPRPTMTTSADRIAARLVHHLDNAPERQMIMQTARLEDFPVRLEGNASLRDSIALLCSVWASYRSRAPPTEFINMPLYGKAIRSLSRTLDTGQAISVETLASIAILQRTEDLFDPGDRRFMHEKGIATLLARLGPPKPNDKFYASLLCECYSILVPYWVKTDWNNMLDDPAWKDAIVACMTDYIGIEELQPMLASSLTQYNHVSQRLPEIMRGMRTINNPSGKAPGFDVSPLISKMATELRDMEAAAGETSSSAMEKAMELKAVTEVNDSTFIHGTCYHFSSTNLVQSLISFVSLHLCLLQLRYKWSSAYQLSDSQALCASFETRCYQLWKFIPFVRKVKLFLANIHQDAFALTLEIANEKEKKYLLDLFKELDSYAPGRFEALITAS
ncbi:unnamed protein product [Clonostachys solani]|uniref:Zn(2)-C6 fungal-type domain-containing protein n=1 Tax=Clonostachys solani TaxID=160281 RepID=A0A9N9ZES2_9HYPO|nr:unnamed protein product [Clonostachys solani]